MKHVVLAAAAIFTFTSAALAADMPTYQPPPPTPVVGKAPIGKALHRQGTDRKGPYWQRSDRQGAGGRQGLTATARPGHAPPALCEGATAGESREAVAFTRTASPGFAAPGRTPTSCRLVRYAHAIRIGEHQRAGRRAASIDAKRRPLDLRTKAQVIGLKPARIVARDAGDRRERASHASERPRLAAKRPAPGKASGGNAAGAGSRPRSAPYRAEVASNGLRGIG